MREVNSYMQALNRGPSENVERIAHLLESAGIGYDYRRPTLVVDGDRNRILYPDFTLHFSSLIVQYFAHPERPDYNRWINRRLQLYRDNHLDVLPVFPPLFVAGWQEKLLEGMVRKLENHLQDYRAFARADSLINLEPFNIGLLVESPYRRCNLGLRDDPGRDKRLV